MALLQRLAQLQSYLRTVTDADSTCRVRRSRNRCHSFFDLPPEAAVRVAYEVILDREPDASGKDAWVTGLASGQLDHRGLCASLLASAEFEQRIRRPAHPSGRTADEPLIIKMDGGPTIQLAPNDWLISQQIAATGTWEPHVTGFLAQALKPGDLFVDIGANLGFFSLLAAKIVGREGRVIAFEPVPRNVQLLLGSISMNGYRNVEVWPVALAAARGIVTMAVDDSHTNALLTDTPTDTRAVAVPGDAVLVDVSARAGMSVVVKADVEGYEYPVLTGMIRFLQRTRATVILEFHPYFVERQREDPRAELEFLLACFESLEVLRTDGTLVRMSTPEDVFGEWRAANEAAQLGEAMHLELVARSFVAQQDGRGRAQVSANRVGSSSSPSDPSTV